MLPRLALTFALAALVCPSILYAQSTQPEPDGVAPAHVAHVDGAVSLEREGRAESSPLNMPLLSGDRLRTMDGRVEVRFADGSTLHLDARSTIDVQSDDLVRLTEGRLRLNILGPRRAVAYRIDSPAGSARITQPGEYRIAFLRGSGETQLEVAVVRGAAEVFTDQGTTPVRAGERAYASAGLMPSYAYAYNSASQDAFDRWSEGRRDVRLGVSSQYLPADMQTYAPLLDESGDWRQTESYGYAWYPRVAPDWRPYYYGRWDSYPRYGWTWIGADRFAWPTHHYGRWGFSARGWYWIPASRWAPAHVSWAYAPGYVSWCPLGFDNRPIFAINILGGGHSPWRGWTALSYSHFGGRGYSVHQRAVNWERFGGQRPRFEPRPSAPGFGRDKAVPRNSTPIRWAGSRDLPPDGGDYRNPRGAGDSPRANSPGDNSTRGRSRLPPSGGRDSGRDVAVPRGDASPRYVNRGDEIIRSQTEPPTPRTGSRTARTDGEGYAIPRQSGGAAARPDRVDRPAAPERNDVRTGVVPRTVPDGAARPSRSESTPFVDGPQARPFERPQSRSRASGGSPVSEPYQPYDPSGASTAPRAEPRGDGAQARPYDGAQVRPYDGAQVRPYDGAQARPYDGAQARPRSSGSPSYEPQQPRGYEPRPAAPRREDAPFDAAQGRPRAYERERPSEAQPYSGGQSRPAPERQSPRAAPVERPPNRGEGREPPAERAAPAPPSAPAPGGGGAVPRRGRGGS